MIIPGAAIWLLSAKSEWSFGCINSDGTLDEAKVVKYLKILKKNRSMFLRQLPYLLKDETGHGQLRVGESAHLPFHYNGSRFDLSRLKTSYFVNLRRLAELANEYGMAFAFCIADRCHGRAMVGPWYNNINGVKGWRDLNSFFRAYVRQVVTVLAGTRTYYIDENEPDGSDYLRYSDELFRFLEQLGVARSRIIAGGEFYHKDPLTQKAAIEAKGRAYRVDGLSTFHHFDDERWAYIFPRYQVQPAKT